MQKCSKALLLLMILKKNKKRLSLLTNDQSYQQIQVFPLLLLA